MPLIITDDEPRGLGYVMVDNTAAATGPVGRAFFEADTYTCTHCSTVVVLNPARRRERYRCKGCSHHICDECAALAVQGVPCKTMQQQYEEHLEELHKRIQTGEIDGTL